MFRTPSTGDGHDAYSVLRYPDFRLFISANFLSSLAQSILSVIVGWELYLRTNSALPLGMVGLVQIIPNVLMAIPAGQFVDRHDHKRIATASASLNAVAALILAALSVIEGPLVLIYACLFLISVARVFRSPTQGTLLVMGRITHPDACGFHPGFSWLDLGCWQSNMVKRLHSHFPLFRSCGRLQDQPDFRSSSPQASKLEEVFSPFLIDDRQTASPVAR